MTGHGGWPMTVFLTPDGEPFSRGTYFPPVPRHGMPSFRQVLAAIARRVERRGATRSTGVGARDRPPRLPGAAAVRRRAAPPAAEDSTPRWRTLRARVRPRRTAASAARRSSRRRWCWSSCCATTRARATSDALADGRARRCEAMARGGIYDQLGGGFARYSRRRALGGAALREDALRQRAAAARLPALVARDRRRRWPRRVARETADCLLARPAHARGRLRLRARRRHATGVEGATYVWTPDAARRGPRRGRRRAGPRRCSRSPRAAPSSTARSTLQLPARPATTRRGWAQRAQPAARPRATRRPQPARDDKVVAAWNGLAIAALAEAGALLGEPTLGRRGGRGGRPARAAAPRRARPAAARARATGSAGRPAGVLEDYGDVAEGFLALYAVTGDARWLAVAGQLLDVVLDHFADGDGGPVRHRRRRARPLRPPAARPDRRRDAIRAVGGGRRPADVRRATPGRPATGRRPSARSGPPRCSRARHRASPAGGSRSPRRWLDGPREVAVVGLGRRPGRATGCTASPCRDRRRVRSSSLGDPADSAAATRTAAARTGRSSTGARRRTSAATSSASAPHRGRRPGAAPSAARTVRSSRRAWPSAGGERRRRNGVIV